MHQFEGMTRQQKKKTQHIYLERSLVQGDFAHLAQFIKWASYRINCYNPFIKNYIYLHIYNQQP